MKALGTKRILRSGSVLGLGRGKGRRVALIALRMRIGLSG